MLSFEPRRPVPWTLVDLLLAGLAGAFLLVIFQTMAVASLRLPVPLPDLESLSIGQQIFISSVTSLASFGFLAVGYLIFRRRHRVTNLDLGWDRARIDRDLTVGVAGYVMLIVPMLLIHALVHVIWPTDESHPFIEMLTRDPRWEFWLPITLIAVGVAPIVEEFIFRVALQGWLEALAVRWERTHAPVVDGASTDWLSANGATNVVTEAEALPPTGADAAPVLAERSEATMGDRLSPADGIQYAYATNTESVSPAEVVTNETATDSSGIPRTPWGRWLPIVGSSLLFAVAHVGQGGAPVALFFLALGLGYIYQRTHRVLPTMVVHFLVNLTAMAQLWQYLRNA